MENQRFEALSRICLNNWHYIKHRTLSFDDGINFFTGHSGSGKSTVIDAMQIVLYANTDGRGFFNKAAADDSDRSLIEYLRGMINIGEDNSFSYLRNQNFSSTIVLELRQTDTGVCQCVGVVFDVETATNEIGRMFFWHKGPIPDHQYRKADRTMSIDEVKNWLLANYSKEECYFGSHNERFRKQLYDIYLGGLDAEKFPLLFKRAIPFRMNIKLEEFVKEYICMEQNIHIDDMRQSVTEYGRLRRRIEDTCKEIEKLKEICGQHEDMMAARKEKEQCGYFARKLDMLQDRRKIQESQDKIQALAAEQEKAARDAAAVETEIQDLTAKSEELLRKISSSGYEELKSQLKTVNELVEHLGSSQARWKQTADKLTAWNEEEITSNRTLWDIEAFETGEISGEALKRLQEDLSQMRKEVERQIQDARSQIREKTKELTKAQEEIAQLKAGNKAYPKELEAVRRSFRLSCF
ncbi:MAG: ATP-binding protein [Clostridium sp.]